MKHNTKLIGESIHNLATELWYINRSITGEGVRKSLKIISKIIPNLKIFSIPSDTRVFDWIVPKEWSVRSAYIITPNGQKICNFSENNLHLLGYSVPFCGNLSLAELRSHLYTLADQPNAIPYVTSYYKDRWGFCLSYEDYQRLEEGIYKVVVDTNLFMGVLNYGELLIKGKSKKEVLLSTYICHPSMANNELSGVSVATYLAKWLLEMDETEYSYRIIFIPETIGSIAYLSQNLETMKCKTIAGFNISCVGDNRSYSYLPSRNGKTLSDLISKHVLKWTEPNFVEYSWLDRASDERQYCAPGVDLPVASILRTKYGEYPEYHTSLDNLKDVVTKEGLDGGYWAIRRAIECIEANKKYIVTVLCEPNMGKRGLYPSLSTKKRNEDVELMMNLISLCDGRTSLLDIAETLNVPMWDLFALVEMLKNENLLVGSNS